MQHYRQWTPQCAVETKETVQHRSSGRRPTPSKCSSTKAIVHKRSCTKTLFTSVRHPAAHQKQTRKNSLPEATLLSQQPPKLIRTEDSTKTAFRQYCFKTEHMASNSLNRQHLRISHESPKTLRSRSCPPSSRTLAQPTDENQRQNRLNGAVLDHRQSPLQGLFQYQKDKEAWETSG